MQYLLFQILGCLIYRLKIKREQELSRIQQKKGGGGRTASFFI